MGASAGQYGVNIGKGAVGGASVGAFAGPWGAAIGGAVGGIGGALSTLLTSQDEAKERKRQLELYRQQSREARAVREKQRFEQSEDDWERRMVALTPGLAQDPMYIAQSYEPYKPEPFASLAKEEQDFNAHMPIEPTPDYGGLAMSLGSLGNTIGGLSRQADLSDKLELAKINSSGNPWVNYADDAEDPMQQILERAREAAQRRTGGW